MKGIIVAGIGTGVGKTVVAAILLKIFQGEYWKPIQAGNLHQCDTTMIKKLVDLPTLNCHPESYRLKHPSSPHYSSTLEGIAIEPSKVRPPHTSRTLIIETAGGLLSPLNKDILQLDHYNSWNCHWILVSRHYLGSINHTLLSIEALHKRKIYPIGIVFNGDDNNDSEALILQHLKTSLSLHLKSRLKICRKTINHYALQWKPQLTTLF